MHMLFRIYASKDPNIRLQHNPTRVAHAPLMADFPTMCGHNCVHLFGLVLPWMSVMPFCYGKELDNKN